MRDALRAFPLAALVATAIAAAVLTLAWQPWDNAGVIPRATGQARTYTFCDLTLEVPAGAEAFLGSDPYTQDPGIVVYIPTDEASQPSSIVLDPATGTELRRRARTPSDDGILDAVEASAHLADPSSPAWPRDDVAPATDRAPIVPGLSYQPPDPEAGIAVQFFGASDGTQELRFSTCNSKASYDLGTGASKIDGVDPSEADMFERLLGEIG
jgi:hypothetical protein